MYSIFFSALFQDSLEIVSLQLLRQMGVLVYLNERYVLKDNAYFQIDSKTTITNGAYLFACVKLTFLNSVYL